MNNIQGWLNIYKPLNLSSFNVIKKIQRVFKFDKIGHAGTLDPLAEGILPIAIGKTTKLITFVKNSKKEYIFEIKWGQQTSTDDQEGAIIAESSKIPNDKKINSTLGQFKGKILQSPPIASAVKINGQRAYKLFRSNIPFQTKKKYVEIFDCKIISETKNKITKFRIQCGQGFYIRSFARDLANVLETKGHIISLKRTKVGKFCIKNSILLDDLLKIRQRQPEFREIHPSISMLDDILAYEIDDENLINKVSHGNSVKIDKNSFLQSSLNISDRSVVFLTSKSNVLSFGKLDGSLFKPDKVLI